MKLSVKLELWHRASCPVHGVKCCRPRSDLDGERPLCL